MSESYILIKIRSFAFEEIKKKIRDRKKLKTKFK